MTEVEKKNKSVVEQAMNMVPKKVKSLIIQAIEELEAKVEDAQEAKVRNLVKVDVNSVYSKAYLDVKNYTKNGLSSGSLHYLRERLEPLSKRAHKIIDKPQNKMAFSNTESNKKTFDNLVNKVHIIDGFLETTRFNEKLVEAAGEKKLKAKHIAELEQAQAEYDSVLRGSTVKYTTYVQADRDDTVSFIKRNAAVYVLRGFND